MVKGKRGGAVVDASDHTEYEQQYRATIQPRTATRDPTVLNNCFTEGFAGTRQSGFEASSGPGGSGGRILKMVTEMGSSSVTGISPALSKNAANSIIQATEKEKKEMQSLNDRLGNYIDRVKALEAQNRKLVSELEDLRNRWGKDTAAIKKEFGGHLTDARRMIDDGTRNKAMIEVQVNRLKDDLKEYRRRYETTCDARRSDQEKIASYTAAIGDANTEIDLLRQRFKSLNDEQARYLRDSQRIQDELEKAKADLDEETISRIDFQNQVQTLMEELEFLRRVHDQEVKELQHLLNSQPVDTREFFKNELALAIRDIKDEYEIIAQHSKSDMESWYRLKVSEVQGANSRATMEGNFAREEVSRLRGNVGDLRNKLVDLEAKNAILEKQVQELTYQLDDDQRQYEAALNEREAQLRKEREACQALIAELQALMDTKQMLDTEIAIYRKMLEGEENRAGLKQMVEQAVKSHSLQQQEDTETQRHVRGEMSTRTTFQRSAKGNVSIAECAEDGKYIILENTHRNKEENLADCKIRRKIDGRREVNFTFPSNTVVKPGKSVKIWARGSGGRHNPPHELIYDGDDTWHTGQNIQTALINKEGEVTRLVLSYKTCARLPGSDAPAARTSPKLFVWLDKSVSSCWGWGATARFSDVERLVNPGQLLKLSVVCLFSIQSMYDQMFCVVGEDGKLPLLTVEHRPVGTGEGGIEGMEIKVSGLPSQRLNFIDAEENKNRGESEIDSSSPSTTTPSNNNNKFDAETW